jgi:uncharacterized protein YgiM (DUF1202 family)
MPRCVVAVLACCVIASADSSILADQRTPPYKAYVSADDVYVRSGPGRNYYPSGKLKTGDQVDVYRHDPGGWYAIKPIEGSFAWVSARFLKVGEDGLAEVTGDRVAARVGSRFSDVRDVIQVRLSRGETVKVLGQKEFKSTSNSGIWYKISPPSGEFRWIHGKYVDPDYMTSGVRTSRTGGSPLLGQADTDPIPDEPRLLSTLTEEPAPSIAISSSPTVGESNASQEAPVAAVKLPAEPTDTALANTTERLPDDGGVPDDKQSPADESQVKTAQHWSPTATSLAAEVVQAVPHAEVQQDGTAQADFQAPLTHRSQLIPELNSPVDEVVNEVAARTFREELSELELELSIMLAEEPTVWNFDETRLGVKSLLANAETALQRGRARALAGKIDQATDIKRRYDSVSDVLVKTERHNRQLSQLSNSRADARVKLAGRTSESVQGRYDGAGRLARVVTPKVGSPAYALLGEDGVVSCYVTPAPGVNLHYYLGRRIGITGIRGLLADRDVRHVTAKHIVEMSKTR